MAILITPEKNLSAVSRTYYILSNIPSNMVVRMRLVTYRWFPNGVLHKSCVFEAPERNHT